MSACLGAASHRRPPSPWHYVPILSRKPGALRNGAPFKGWALPAALEHIRRKLRGSDDGDRQMVAILAGGRNRWTAAGRNRQRGSTGRRRSLRQRDPPPSRGQALNIPAPKAPGPPVAIMTPEALRLRHAPVADCARHDSLRSAISLNGQSFLILMGALKLYGMRASYDEGMARRHRAGARAVPGRGRSVQGRIAQKPARSIKCRMTIAKPPPAKAIDDFDFTGLTVDETLARTLAGGDFLGEQRHAVPIGGTGAGKSRLAIAIARGCIRRGARGRFFNAADLVNRLESQARAGRQGRLADYPARLDFVVLDELGYRPLLKPAACSCSIWSAASTREPE